MKPIDLLAFGAHPDDVELGAGGTVRKHIEQGFSAAIIDITRGELGSRGTAETRDLEAQEAGKIIGLSHRENLGWSDGFFEETKDNILEMARIIRIHQPRWIIGNAISDRHPDHGRAAKILDRANFLAGLPKIEILHNGVKLSPHRAQRLAHYIQDRNIGPHFVVDVTAQWDVKMNSIAAYKTQFYQPNSNEPETPISSLDFWHFLEARGREFGRMAGVTFAEGFTSATPIGIQSFENIL